MTLPRGEKAGEQIRLPALPVEFDNERPGLYRDLPGPGADSREVLLAAGYSEAEVDELFASGAAG